MSANTLILACLSQGIWPSAELKRLLKEACGSEWQVSQAIRSLIEAGVLKARRVTYYSLADIDNIYLDENSQAELARRVAEVVQGSKQVGSATQEDIKLEDELDRLIELMDATSVYEAGSHPGM